MKNACAVHTSSTRIIVGSTDKGLCELIVTALEPTFAVQSVDRSSDLLLNILKRDFALLIIDMDLAEIDGARTLEIVKSTRPKLPIVFITDDPSVETGRSVMQHGVNYYAIKPVDAEEVTAVVHGVLGVQNTRSSSMEPVQRFNAKDERL